MNIGILGSGSFGTALAKTCSFHRENEIILYTIEPKVLKDIQKNGRNDQYLPGVDLPENVSVTSEISDLQYCDLWIFVVPSRAYESVCEMMRPFYSGQIIVSASKGLGAQGEVLTDVIERVLKVSPKKVLALSGPSIALEIAQGKPTAVILGGDRNTTQNVKRVFETETFFVRCSRDKKGIQLLGFYKNLLAILVGLCEGLKLGDNFKSALVTKAYSEFYYLNQNKNIARHSFIDFAGLGDLYVTSTSAESRNRSFGKALGENNSLQSVQKKIGNVVEGYENLLRLLTFCDVKDRTCSSVWFEINLVKTLFKIISAETKLKRKQILLQYLRSAEIKTLVFDWGNVLTQGCFSLRVSEILAKQYGLPVRKVFLTLEKFEKDALMGKDTLQDFFEKMQNVFPMFTFGNFRDAYTQAITWNTELLAYCKKLSAHYDLYILSNNYSWVADKLKPKLRSIFKDCLFSHEVGMMKPHQDIFSFLIDKHHLRPENCLYIDDSHRNILAGERNKFQTVEFGSLPDLQKALREKIVDFQL